MKSLLAALFLWVSLTGIAHAHPVAQGQLAIRWQNDVLLVTARVTSEQILVAGTLGPLTAKEADSIDAMWQDHGRYLLQHLQVRADDRRLSGRVLRVTPGTDDFVIYDLAYPLPTWPQELRLQQDFLNEIEYVPGNHWEATFLVELALADEPQQHYLLASNDQPLLLTEPAAGTHRKSFGQSFFLEGVHHILTGYDHLLFVSALVLGALRLSNLISILAAFTLAHSLTLTLSVLNVLRLPPEVIEPMIAGSIVVVAFSNLVRTRNTSGLVRAGMAFFFGLFHGLGFAGGLLTATQDLSGSAVAVAIAAFSAGVEGGHLLVVVPLFLALRFLRQASVLGPTPAQSASVAVRGGSTLVLLVGVAYLVRATGL